MEHQSESTGVAANVGEHEGGTALRTRPHLVLTFGLRTVAIARARPVHGKSRYSQRPIAHVQAARLKLK
jgi:hypothetical protein